MLKAASIRNGTRLLDIGCGPGHLCSTAAKRGAIITGCDYSAEMLRIAKLNYPDLNFLQEDAEALSFDSCSFDSVVLNYLLLHVSNQNTALLEAARILKPNGKLIYTMWLPPPESPGLGLMFAPLKQYADMSVIPPAQDIFEFASTEKAKDFLGKNGFKDIETKVFNTAWHIDSGEKFFEAVQAGTKIGGLIELQEPKIKEKIKATILHNIEEFRLNEGYVIPTPSLIVSAASA